MRRLPHTTTRAFRRPVTLLLACMLAVMGLMAAPGASPPLQGTLQVFLYHDRNASGYWDDGDDTMPAGVLTLGLSGSSLETVTTRLDSGYNWNALLLEEGDWSFSADALTGNYRLTDGYSVEYRQSGRQTRHQYASGGSTVRVDAGQVSRLYIPVLLNFAGGTVSGTVRYTDGGGISGALVELLDAGGQTAASTLSGADGGYQLGDLPPGSYRLRATAASPQDYTVSPDSLLSDTFTLADGGRWNDMDFAFSRTASVTFWMGGVQLAQYPAIAYGARITEPVIDRSALTTPGGRRQITGWFRDAALTQPWNFETDTVTADLQLHARWRVSSSGASSGSSTSTSSRGSTNRSDGVSRPKIGQVTATVNGTTALLSVRMEGFADFEYHWQRQDQNGYWYDLPGADTASYSFQGMVPGETYTFRVGVTRLTDGLTTFSQPVTASTADALEEWTPAETPGVPVPQAPATTDRTSEDRIGETGELLLALSTEDAIYAGGRLVAVPSIPGGSWEYNEEILAGDLTGEPTFTALRAGSTVLTYRVDGSAVSHRLDIRPATLPATGQSVTAPVCLAGLGLIALSAGLLSHRRQKEVRHDRHR